MRSTFAGRAADWLVDELPAIAFAALGIGLLVLLFYAIREDHRAMEAYGREFMADCLQAKPRAECDILWRTYVAAHNAEVNASIAIGVAAGAAGAASGRR